MKMKKLFMFFAVCASVAAASVPANAAKKSFDIYSWKQEGTVNYCYAILPSSKDPRTADQIKTSPDKACGGNADLKRIVGQVAPIESKLFWKVDAANGLVLPTRDIVNDFKRFVKTMPYKLEVAEPH